MTSYTRKLVFISLTLVSAAALTMAQAIKPNRQNSHPSDDKPIYFNAEAREVIQPGTQPTDKVSATSIGNVLSVLFDSAKLSVQTENDPLSATWVSTIAVPINTTGQKLTSYSQQIRGAVLKTETSRVCVVLSLGGQTFVKEYPFGTKSTGNVLWKFVSPIKPQPAGRYVATIVIMVERRDPKGAVLVNVDSLDVEVKAIKKGGK